jgi:hypothetical protein
MNYRNAYLFLITKGSIRNTIFRLDIALAVTLLGSLALCSQIVEISFASQSLAAYPVLRSLDTNRPAQTLKNSLGIGNFNLTQNISKFIEGQNIVLQGIISSTDDPLPGHETHQVATILPVANDSLVYSGLITFTATQPVEVQIYHMYEMGNATRISEQFGLNSISNDRMQVISMITPDYVPTPLYSTSVLFTGNGVALHTLSGKPFIAAYTVDVKINKVLTLNDTEDIEKTPLATMPIQDQILEPQQAPSSYITVPNLLVEALTTLGPDVIGELPLDRLAQDDLLKIFNSPPDKITKILDKLPPDKITKILDKLPPDKRAEILDKLPPT